MPLPAQSLATEPPGVRVFSDAGLLPMLTVSAMLLAVALVLLVASRRRPRQPGAARVDRRLAWPVPGSALLFLTGVLVAMGDNEVFGRRLLADDGALPLVLAGVALLGGVGVWLLALFVSRADVR